MTSGITRRDFIASVSAGTVAVAGAGGILADTSKIDEGQGNGDSVKTKNDQTTERAFKNRDFAGGRQTFGFEFTFGLKDEHAADWSGSIEILSAAGGEIAGAHLLALFPAATIISCPVISLLYTIIRRLCHTPLF